MPHHYQRHKNLRAQLPNGGYLEGTLDLPSSPNGQIFIIIPGSGTIDRDGNYPDGTGSDIYKLLGEGLSKAGHSVLRIDKRGMFGSKTAVEDANDVTLLDYAHDIRTWIKELREQGNMGPIWLVGHSEGGLIALKTAVLTPDDICGLILLAAPGVLLGNF